MKDFKHFGLKRRVFLECNYLALWHDLFTTRVGQGVASELPCDQSEFYDVGINTKCNAECPFCYVSATGQGVNYPNICETWKKWMDTFWDVTSQKYKVTYTNKPFQIAIGSTGEPTIHPEFCDFLRTVYETGVVPNYTTNGVTLAKPGKLSEDILEATRKYVGGVAVSFGNKALREYAKTAIEKLLEYGETMVNIHHIISDEQSVEDFVKVWKEYGDKINYHVLLPLMPSGRSTEGTTEEVFKFLEKAIKKEGIKNIAFGAHFIKYLRNSSISVSLYNEQAFSKNIILTPNKVQITPSSFDLKCIKSIEFQ